MELQQITGALMHHSNRADAEKFFEVARASEGVRSLRPDGTVLSLDGSFAAPESAAAASLQDTVRVVIAGRLLDGRSFMVPTYSDGPHKEPDSVVIPLSDMPENLALGVVGMREGEVRTIYIHPDASEGIASLFSAQPFPPQSVMIFDFKLMSTNAGEQDAAAAPEQGA
jgi:FKBP-type peptidyl-prolyl cis-trans isomerase